MSRSVLASGLSGLLLFAGLAVAQDQAPPLTPPALDPPSTGPSTTTPRPGTTSGSGPGTASSLTTKPARTAPAENRPLLLVPGVTAPLPSRPGPCLSRPRPGPGTGPAASTTPAAPLTSRPPTSPPIELPDASNESSLKGRAPIPLTLESIADEPPAELGSDRLPADRSATPRSPRPSSARPLSEPTDALGPLPSPQRLRGSATIFGRLFRPQGSGGEPAEPRSSISAEPRSDSAADAAIKKRIEKEVQQAVGDRVRSVEIRISGRSVIIRARATCFWQRRGVRRSLETMHTALRLTAPESRWSTEG